MTIDPPDLEAQLAKLNDFIRSSGDRAKSYIQRGMIQFKLARIDESIADFDRAEQLDPSVTPYLWQRGLSYYYAERFSEGAKQFEIDLSVNTQDVEETVWRYLCIARDRGTKAARKSLLPVKNDPRRVMGQIYDLFAGNCTPEAVLAAGDREGKRGQFYSHLYLGLYCEVAGDVPGAKTYILAAASQYPLDDYMWHLTRIHAQLRGWT